MDTKIWDAESDRYTARAIKDSSNKLYKEKHELKDIYHFKKGAIEQ